MHNRLDLPIEPSPRVKTGSINVEETPVPGWKKKSDGGDPQNERSTESTFSNEIE